MSGAVSLLDGQDSDGALADGLAPAVLKRRAAQRRQMLGVQAASCSLITLVLLVYYYAGTIAIIVPAAYFLSGIALIGFFAVLSETHVNDRFEDHYLTIFQVGGHVALQLGFLLAGPGTGYVFFVRLVFDFEFGA